jgi:transcriptional regulator with XRE-family HTH domain
MSQHIMLRWMEIHNKTVDEIAEAAGCTPPHIRNLLAGRRDASLSLAKKLSDISGGVIPLDAFLSDAS